MYDAYLARRTRAVQERDGIGSSVKRKASRAPKPTPPDLSDAEVKERYRLYLCMGREELRMYDAYLARRTRAVQERDRAEMERWDRKMQELYDQVMRRELRMHFVVDRLDANTV